MLLHELTILLSSGYIIKVKYPNTEFSEIYNVKRI